LPGASVSQNFLTHSASDNANLILLYLKFNSSCKVSKLCNSNFSREQVMRVLRREHTRRGCEFHRPPRLTLVGIHTRAFLRATSSGMQMSAGCIRSITQNARDGLFLRCGKETRGEFERAEKSDAPRFARSLRKRKFAKFAHALGLKCCALRNP